MIHRDLWTMAADALLMQREREAMLCALGFAPAYYPRRVWVASEDLPDLYQFARGCGYTHAAALQLAEAWHAQHAPDCECDHCHTFPGGW